MSTAIELACAAEASIAAKHLAAVKSAGFESLISLIALDVAGMTASIPTDAAVAKLLKLMVEKDNTLKIDNDVDLRIARLIAFHVAAAHKNSSAPAAAPAAAPAGVPSSTAAAEKLAAEAFGTAAYASYEEKTLDVVPPKYRAPGKDIKQVVDDLNRGTLRKEAWQLHLQKKPALDGRGKDVRAHRRHRADPQRASIRRRPRRLRGGADAARDFHSQDGRCVLARG